MIDPATPPPAAPAPPAEETDTLVWTPAHSNTPTDDGPDVEAFSQGRINPDAVHELAAMGATVRLTLLADEDDDDAAVGWEVQIPAAAVAARPGLLLTSGFVAHELGSAGTFSTLETADPAADGTWIMAGEISWA